jgi:hypothetical protein
MKILYFIIALIISSVIIYGGMFLIVRKYKITNTLTKQLISTLTLLIFIGSIMIIQSIFSDFSPEPINTNSRITTLQEAEERINNLETYTQKLETDLYFANASLHLLIGGLFLIQSCFWVQIVISLSKAQENKDTDFLN